MTLTLRMTVTTAALVTSTIRQATAATRGSLLYWTYWKMKTGSVTPCTPARKSVTIASSNETRKAKIEPANMLDRIGGRVTVTRTTRGEAPRLRAESSTDGSIVSSPAVTVRTT